MSSAVPLILSPSQLRRISPLGHAVSLLDATWFMPNSPRKARDEFLAKRIPGAQFLDLDEVASPNALGLKHMMPTERVFADACERFGISPSSHVVLYDTHGVFSSPRALFMFRAFGHHKSSILDGGLPRWEEEGFAIETVNPSGVQKTNYPIPALSTDMIRSYEQIVSNSALNPLTDSSAELVVDARSQGRFLGRDPEPRPGLSSGHIPYSFSLPFSAFLQKHESSNATEYTTFLPKADLHRALVEAVGSVRAKFIIDGEKPVITSCGSGMTAGVLWLGLKLLGVENIGLYDESWSGYAVRPSSKIDKSE